MSGQGIGSSGADIATRPNARSAEPSQAGGDGPIWSTGRPTERGIYLGRSDLPQRCDRLPSIYAWTGQTFQHASGWYDNGVTHWIKTDLPGPDGEAGGPSSNAEADEVPGTNQDVEIADLKRLLSLANERLPIPKPRVDSSLDQGDWRNHPEAP